MLNQTDRRSLSLGALLAPLLAACAASAVDPAQLAPDPPDAVPAYSNTADPAAGGYSEVRPAVDSGSVLFLKGEAKLYAFRNQELLAPTRLVRASAQPLALQLALQDLDDLSIELGADTRTLDEYFEQQNTAGLVVVKDGAIVYERYALGNDQDSRWVSFSVAKSLVSLLYGVAVKDGLIRSLDDPVTDYLPALKNSAYSTATIRHLLQMASGVAWNEDYADPESDVASASYETLALYEHLRNKPRTAPAGERFNYNTAETNLAGTLLRSAIGNNLSSYLQNRIWQPFGMAADAYWLLTEPGGGEFGGCCINATLRDYARIGLFALADGVTAEGVRLLPPGWMAESTTPSPGYDGYGYFWWLTEGSAYRASGIFGQSIYIDPDRNLVIAVHSANDAADSEADWAWLQAMQAAFAARLAD
ncbi:MAG: serine hydrolase [Pseudomonadota bacterium]